MTYPFEVTKYLCMSSCLMGISSIVLYQLKEKLVSFMMGILCFTSINHWRHYVLCGWRQRLDIAWVTFASILFTVFTLCRSEFHIYLGLSLCFTAIVLFLLTHLCEKYWVVCHSAIHLYAAFFVPLVYIL